MARGRGAGSILSKRERAYKPSAIRGYDLALRLRALPALGNRRLADIDLADLLELKEQLQGEGCSPSTIRNTFVPLQAIYRRARLQGRVPIDPTIDLPLPTAEARKRAATPPEAFELLAGLTGGKRAAAGALARARAGDRARARAVGDGVPRRVAPRRAAGAPRPRRRPGRGNDQRRARVGRHVVDEAEALASLRSLGFDPTKGV